jgi:hypothetical protein
MIRKEPLAALLFAVLAVSTARPASADDPPLPPPAPVPAPPPADPPAAPPPAAPPPAAPPVATDLPPPPAPLPLPTAAPPPVVPPPPAPLPPTAAPEPPAPPALPPPVATPPAVPKKAPSDDASETAAPPEAAPRPAAQDAADKPAEDEVRDGFRLRGGFSVNGGIVRGANGVGPAFGFGARIGLQFNHYFAIYYQNTPLVTFTPETGPMSAGFHAGFADYNSILANLTLLHMIDLGAGPSFDYALFANCSAGVAGFVPSAGCKSGTSTGIGAHARVALNIGGLSGNGPRRSGFSIGVDLHPIFPSDGSLAFSATAGLGGEWY